VSVQPYCVLRTATGYWLVTNLVSCVQTVCTTSASGARKLFPCAPPVKFAPALTPRPVASTRHPSVWRRAWFDEESTGQCLQHRHGGCGKCGAANGSVGRDRQRPGAGCSGHCRGGVLAAAGRPQEPQALRQPLHPNARQVHVRSRAPAPPAWIMDHIMLCAYLASLPRCCNLTPRVTPIAPPRADDARMS
jgi:hypothetical protein